MEKLEDLKKQRQEQLRNKESGQRKSVKTEGTEAAITHDREVHRCRMVAKACGCHHQRKVQHGNAQGS